MHEETLKDKTAKGLFWGGISNVLQQILGLVFGIILLRVLDAKDYGMVGMLAVFMGIASTIQESGFTAALINKKDFKHEDYNAVFWFNILTGVAIYIILFFFAPLIAEFYEKPELIDLSRFLFVGIVFAGVGIAHNAVLAKKLMVKERAKIDVMSLLLSGVVGVALALNGFAYWGLAVQSVTYIVVSTFLKWYFSPWQPTLYIDFIPLKNMFSFSIKLFLTNIFWQLNTNIFSVLLGKFYSTKDVGYYSQGNKWTIMGSTVIVGMINGIAQPVLTQMNNDVERQRNAFRKMLRFGAFISFPLMLGLAFVGKEFLLIAGGEKWLPSVPFLQLFSIWGAAYYIWHLYINLLISHGKSNVYLSGMLLVGLLQLAVVSLMFSYGIFYMVFFYIVAYYIGLFFLHYYVKKIIGLDFLMFLKDVIPYLLITLGTFFITWILTVKIDNLYVLFVSKIMISTIIYILIMWKSNSVIFRESLTYLKLDKLFFRK